MRCSVVARVATQAAHYIPARWALHRCTDRGHGFLFLQQLLQHPERNDALGGSASSDAQLEKGGSSRPSQHRLGGGSVIGGFEGHQRLFHDIQSLSNPDFRLLFNLLALLPPQGGGASSAYAPSHDARSQTSLLLREMVTWRLRVLGLLPQTHDEDGLSPAAASAPIAAPPLALGVGGGGASSLASGPSSMASIGSLEHDLVSSLLDMDSTAPGDSNSTSSSSALSVGVEGGIRGSRSGDDGDEWSLLVAPRRPPAAIRGRTPSTDDDYGRGPSGRAPADPDMLAGVLLQRLLEAGRFHLADTVFHLLIADDGVTEEMWRALIAAAVSPSYGITLSTLHRLVSAPQFAAWPLTSDVATALISSANRQGGAAASQSFVPPFVAWEIFRRYQMSQPDSVSALVTQLPSPRVLDPMPVLALFSAIAAHRDPRSATCYLHWRLVWQTFQALNQTNREWYLQRLDDTSDLIYKVVSIVGASCPNPQMVFNLIVWVSGLPQLSNHINGVQLAVAFLQALYRAYDQSDAVASNRRAAVTQLHLWLFDALRLHLEPQQHFGVVLHALRAYVHFGMTELLTDLLDKLAQDAAGLLLEQQQEDIRRTCIDIQCPSCCSILADKRVHRKRVCETCMHVVPPKALNEGASFEWTTEMRRVAAERKRDRLRAQAMSMKRKARSSLTTADIATSSSLRMLESADVRRQRQGQSLHIHSSATTGHRPWSHYQPLLLDAGGEADRSSPLPGMLLRTPLPASASVDRLKLLIADEGDDSASSSAAPTGVAVRTKLGLVTTLPPDWVGLVDDGKAERMGGTSTRGSDGDTSPFQLHVQLDVPTALSDITKVKRPAKKKLLTEGRATEDDIATSAWKCVWCDQVNAPWDPKDKCAECHAETGPKASWRQFTFTNSNNGNNNRVSRDDSPPDFMFEFRSHMQALNATLDEAPARDQCVTLAYKVMMYRRRFQLSALSERSDFHHLHALIHALVRHGERVMAAYLYFNVYPAALRKNDSLLHELALLFHFHRQQTTVSTVGAAVPSSEHLSIITVREMINAKISQDRHQNGRRQGKRDEDDYEAEKKRRDSESPNGVAAGATDSTSSSPSSSTAPPQVPSSAETDGTDDVLLLRALLMNNARLIAAACGELTCVRCFSTAHVVAECPIAGRRRHLERKSSDPSGSSPPPDPSAVANGDTPPSTGTKESPTSVPGSQPFEASLKQRLALQTQTLLASIYRIHHISVGRGSQETESSSLAVKSSSPMADTAVSRDEPEEDEQGKAVLAAYENFLRAPDRELLARTVPNELNFLCVQLCRVMQPKRAAFVLCHIPMGFRLDDTYVRVAAYYGVPEDDLQTTLSERPPVGDVSGNHGAVAADGTMSPRGVGTATVGAAPSEGGGISRRRHPNLMQVTRNCCVCLDGRHAAHACPKLDEFWTQYAAASGSAAATDGPRNASTPSVSWKVRIDSWLHSGPERRFAFQRFVTHRLDDIDALPRCPPAFRYAVNESIRVLASIAQRADPLVQTPAEDADAAAQARRLYHRTPIGLIDADATALMLALNHVPADIFGDDRPPDCHKLVSPPWSCLICQHLTHSYWNCPELLGMTPGQILGHVLTHVGGVRTSERGVAAAADFVQFMFLQGHVTAEAILKEPPTVAVHLAKLSQRCFACGMVARGYGVLRRVPVQFVTDAEFVSFYRSAGCAASDVKPHVIGNAIASVKTALAVAKKAIEDQQACYAALRGKDLPPSGAPTAPAPTKPEASPSSRPPDTAGASAGVEMRFGIRGAKLFSSPSTVAATTTTTPPLPTTPSEGGRSRHPLPSLSSVGLEEAFRAARQRATEALKAYRHASEQPLCKHCYRHGHTLLHCDVLDAEVLFGRDVIAVWRVVAASPDLEHDEVLGYFHDLARFFAVYHRFLPYHILGVQRAINSLATMFSILNNPRLALYLYLFVPPAYRMIHAAAHILHAYGCEEGVALQAVEATARQYPGLLGADAGAVYEGPSGHTWEAPSADSSDASNPSGRGSKPLAGAHQAVGPDTPLQYSSVLAPPTDHLINYRLPVVDNSRAVLFDRYVPGGNATVDADLLAVAAGLFDTPARQQALRTAPQSATIEDLREAFDPIQVAVETRVGIKLGSRHAIFASAVELLSAPLSDEVFNSTSDSDGRAPGAALADPDDDEE